MDRLPPEVLRNIAAHSSAETGRSLRSVNRYTRNSIAQTDITKIDVTDVLKGVSIGRSYDYRGKPTNEFYFEFASYEVQVQVAKAWRLLRVQYRHRPSQKFQYDIEIKNGRIQSYEFHWDIGTLPLYASAAIGYLLETWIPQQLGIQQFKNTKAIMDAITKDLDSQSDLQIQPPDDLHKQLHKMKQQRGYGLHWATPHNIKCTFEIDKIYIWIYPLASHPKNKTIQFVIYKNQLSTQTSLPNSEAKATMKRLYAAILRKIKKAAREGKIPAIFENPPFDVAAQAFFNAPAGGQPKTKSTQARRNLGSK